MPVKRGPRRRYVLFRIAAGPPVTRNDVIYALLDVIKAKRPELAESARDRFFVILVDKGWGILKCSPADRDAACDLLSGIKAAGRPPFDVKVETVATSGTIRTLKERAGLPLARPPQPSTPPAGDKPRPARQERRG